MARDTASVPITEPAPWRFSITMVGPCADPICSASKRAKVSAGPPCGTGAMILMVLVVCDHAPWPDGDEDDGTGEMQELAARKFHGASTMAAAILAVPPRSASAACRESG
jgi:hypothetical protein